MNEIIYENSINAAFLLAENEIESDIINEMIQDEVIDAEIFEEAYVHFCEKIEESMIEEGFISDARSKLNNAVNSVKNYGSDLSNELKRFKKNEIDKRTKNIKKSFKPLQKELTAFNKNEIKPAVKSIKEKLGSAYDSTKNAAGTAYGASKTGLNSLGRGAVKTAGAVATGYNVAKTGIDHIVHPSKILKVAVDRSNENKAIAAENNGDRAEAIKYYKKLGNNSKLDKLEPAHARDLANQGRYREALDHTNNFLQRYPSNKKANEFAADLKEKINNRVDF